MSQKFLGPSSNIHSLLGAYSRRNRIICLDYLGPLKIARTMYTTDEINNKRKSVPKLPKEFQNLKVWLSVKV